MVLNLRQFDKKIRKNFGKGVSKLGNALIASTGNHIQFIMVILIGIKEFRNFKLKVLTSLILLCAVYSGVVVTRFNKIS